MLFTHHFYSAFAISQSSFFWLPWDLWAFRQSCNFTVQKPINNKNFFKIYLSGQHCLRSNHQTTDISTFWVCAEQCRALHFSPDFFCEGANAATCDPHSVRLTVDPLLCHLVVNPLLVGIRALSLYTTVTRIGLRFLSAQI